MKKALLIMAGLVIFASWFSVFFFGFPINNSMELSGATLITLVIILIVMKINKKITKNWQRFVIYVVFMFFDIYLIGTIFFYFHGFK